MNNRFKVAIVGGGASGLSLAVSLIFYGVNGKDVLILERNDRVGKKLLATGNGQGNVSNARIEKAFYHGDEKIVSAFLNGLKTFNLKDWFYSLGVALKEDEEGKIYPVSKQANAVLDAFRAFLNKNGVNIVTGAKVTAIEKVKDAFTLYAGEERFYSDTVALAFGGASGKQFGTDGTSYALAETFGHKITPLYPSLVQLKTKTDKIRGLKGIKERARVTVLDGEKKIKSETGEVLFTEYGVSGSAVFKVSGYCAGLSRPKIKIEFLPDSTEEDVARIVNDKLRLDFLEKDDILSGLVNKILGRAILKTVGELSPERIAGALKNFTLDITGNTGFNNSQVTKGGIDGGAIDPDTFESKLQNGLFITGEALNVDGDCGGYNLTFAFYSACRAAQAIAKKLGK